MFVVLSNRSLKPDSSISAWNYESDNESSARVRGEVFFFFFRNLKAIHNSRFSLMFRRRATRIASFTQRVQ